MSMTSGWPAGPGYTGSAGYTGPHNPPPPGFTPFSPLNGPGPAPAPGAGGTNDQRDALAIIQAELKQWGITDPTAAQWAWGLITTGAGSSQIQLTMYDQPWFKARFPYYDALSKAGLPTNIAPTQLIDMENSYRAALRQQGHDVSHIGPADFVPLVVNDESPAEFTQRLEDYRKLKTVYGPHLRAGFEQHAGITGVSDEDLYGMLSGLRPDLAANYAAKTGAPLKTLSFADITEAERKALAEDQAQFQAGGQTAAPQGTSDEERLLQQRQSTFA